jgi:2-amino-4-hydroxy-6-hydroxymethyldihydropteridine diphosphokinase
LSEVKQTKEHQVIIGLGSNISPAENLKSALYLLGQYAPIEAISDVWQTRAVGSKGPDFLNAAVLISSPLSYDELRNQILRPIENLLGRVRTKDPNSPRTIDLDILIVDGELIDQDLWKYAHACVPVAKLLPDFHNPMTGESIQIIADRLIESGSIKHSSLELYRTSPT